MAIHFKLNQAEMNEFERLAEIARPVLNVLPFAEALALYRKHG